MGLKPSLGNLKSGGRNSLIKHKSESNACQWREPIIRLWVKNLKNRSLILI